VWVAGWLRDDDRPKNRRLRVWSRSRRWRAAEEPLLLVTPGPEQSIERYLLAFEAGTCPTPKGP
jgi:hypothetical protein